MKTRVENMDEKQGMDFIKKSVTEVEALRIAEMKNIEMLQQVKTSAMQLEAERLTLKYGAAHPQVVKLNERLAYNKQMLPALNTEIQRTEPNNTILDDDTYRLQGRVFDGKLRPVANITVFLTDEKGSWVRELGNYCTAEDGFYRFALNEEMVKRLQQKNLFLAASDANQKLLCNSKTSITIQPNHIEYRDIYLGTKNCAPPPNDGKRDDVVIINRDEEKARTEAEKKRLEEEAKARKEAEEKAKAEAEAKARKEAEDKAKKDEEAKRKLDEESKRKAEEEARAKKEAEDKTRIDEDRKRTLEEERKRKAEEARAKKEAEEKAKADAENKRRLEEKRTDVVITTGIRKNAPKPGNKKASPPSKKAGKKKGK